MVRRESPWVFAICVWETPSSKAGLSKEKRSMARSRWACVNIVKTSLLSLMLKLLHKLSGNVLRGIGVPTNVALGTMAQSPFQFIRVGMGDFGKLKGKGVAKVMRTQWGNL